MPTIDAPRTRPARRLPTGDRRLRLLIVAIALSMAMAVGYAWLFWALQAEAAAFSEARVRLTANIGRILLLDEVLTMSARMAAANGDRRYEDRYDQYDPELDRLIKETLALAPVAAREEVQATDAANQRLVEMERRSFALNREGRAAEAMALLTGPDYAEQKQIYARGMAATFTAMQAAQEAHQRQLQLYQVAWQGLGGLGLAVVFAGWFFAIHTLAQRQRAEAALRTGEEALRQLNAELERRVAERTGELAAANQELAAEIADREQIEAALRESEGQLRAIIDTTAIGAVRVGLDGHFITTNRAFQALVGYSADELRGMDASVLSHPDDLEAGHGRIRRLLAGEVDHYQAEKRYLRQDGQVIWVDLTVSLVRDAQRTPQFLIGMAQDITERKRIEAELQQQAEELARARDAALAATRVKSEFLATMSHEIRTPMNGVIGMTGLLLDTELTDEQREYAETVRQSGEALLAIINDILDFSKIEAGKLDLEVVDFELRQAVEDAVDLLAERAAAKGLELAVGIDPAVPDALRGDPSRLRQVLLNLTGNAVKFTERGEVVVRVSLAEATEATAVIRVEIADTGVGMSAEAQARLFEPFTQADSSTTRRYGGTGLGLAICKQLVELMAGQIGVVSAPGHGSTFWFSVPFARRAQSADQPCLLAAHRPDLRLLIVDDNATNRAILTRQLTSWGLANDAAADGSQALAMLTAAAAAGRPYQLAILDMHMPGMDGLMLAQRIKADPALAATVLVSLSSLGQLDGEAARRAGVAAMLTKPVHQRDLCRCLAPLLATPASAPGRSNGAGRAVGRAQPGVTQAAAPAHILVAEDNAVNQQVAVRLLAKLGYRADVAANGLEAVAALERIAYDLVLMDCQMPEMDGFAATAAIRRREGPARRTPIVAMTANAMQGDRERCLATGMDDYLTKPVTIEALAGLLQRWLAPVESAPPPVAPATSDPARFDGIIEPASLARLRALQSDGAPDVVTEVVDLFLRETPSYLTAIREALAQGDAERLQRAAHTLKGSCATIGVGRLQTLCADLEALAGAGTIDGADALVGALCSEFEQARVHMRGA